MTTKGNTLSYGLLMVVMLLFAGSVFASSPVAQLDNDKGVTAVEEVSFKLANDTGADFSYFVNGAKETIKDGQVKSVTLEAGTQVYHEDGGKQGSLWFEVTSSMNGKKFNVSDL